MNNKNKILTTLAFTCVFTAMFSMSVMAKASKRAVVTTTTTTTTTTEATTEQTTEQTTIEATETTTEIVTNAQGVPLTAEELEVYNIVKNTPKNTFAAMVTPTPVDTFTQTDDFILSQRIFDFPSGNWFWMKRVEFKSKQDNRYQTSFTLAGNSIEIRYLNNDKSWYMSTNPDNTSKTTMYIDTDQASMIISVPAVYKNSFQSNTLTVCDELEQKVDVKKVEGGYQISYSFPFDPDYVGEIWALQSKDKLANWNDSSHFAVLSQDLSAERRLSWDGYYFPTPYNYTPGGKNVLYRQPSNYSGASFVKYGSFPAAYELGYVSTYLCMQNQNLQGYWSTGPESEWLKNDFNIGGGFYDTRFNTDFASNLIDAYSRYNNPEFLTAVVEYCEFFVKHVQNHSYTTKNGGILVEDYAGSNADYTRTHVSLNHQLAELNLLYDVYNLTNEEKYRTLADKMLLAIEDTREQWVLQNNNLNYAVEYVGEHNTMVDYPYLTYNDLYTTKKKLSVYFNVSNPTIEYLMSCKLEWMKQNNVTGYYTD